MTDPSFAQFTTITCGTERATLTGGYSTNLTGLSCMPLAPIDPETQLRMQINTPNRVLETFLQDNPDIKKGDKLVIGTSKYPIKAVEDWTWFPGGDTLVHLIVEDLSN